MRFNWKVFVVAFVFSLVIGVLSIIFGYLVQALNLRPEMLSGVWYFISVTRFVISPFLLFASFYLIGRNLDLRAEFPSVLLPLFFGSWVGHLIGFYPLALWDNPLYIVNVESLLSFIWYGISSALSFEFFVEFSALSMAYLLKTRFQHSEPFQTQ